MTGRKWLWGTLAGTAAMVGGTEHVLGQQALPAAAPAAPAVAGTQAAAVVNGEVVSLADLEAMMKSNGASQQQANDPQQRQQQIHALFMLVDQRLMHQFLARNGKPIDPAEIDRKLGDLQKGLQQQGKTLADFCREMNKSEAQLRDGLAITLQWYGWASERVKEEDVQKYYEDFKPYFDQVTVRVSHIVLRVPYTASPGEREQAQARLKEIRAQILAGKMDFASAAKQYSNCPMSTDKGGDLGYIQRKYMVDESIARAAYALKPGEISEPVDSEFGVHILVVTDRKAGRPADYAKIKDAVRELYIEDLYRKVLLEQRKVARIEWHLPGMVPPPPPK